MANHKIHPSILRRKKRRRRIRRFLIFLILLGGGATAAHYFYRPLPDLYEEFKGQTDIWLAAIQQSNTKTVDNDQTGETHSFTSPYVEPEPEPNPITEAEQKLSEAMPLYQEGKRLFEANKFEKAREQFTLAIDIHSEFEDAYYLRAQSFYELARFDESVEDFSRVIGVNDQNGNAFFYRAKAYEAREIKYKACEDYQKALDLGIDDASYYLESYCQ